MSGTPGRENPASEAAEEAVLSAMLMSEDGRRTALELLEPEDFYRPRYGHLFEVIAALDARGESVDAVAVADECKARGLDLTVADLSGALFSPSKVGNVRQHCRTVARLAAKRSLIGLAGELAEAGYAPEVDPDVALAKAEAELFRLAGRRQHAAVDVELNHALSEWLDSYERDAPGLACGWRDLDAKIIGGLRPGQYVVVGGRPSVGKSLFGTAWALNVAEQTNRGSLLVSAEMTRQELTERLIASAAAVLLTDVRMRNLSDSQWAKVSYAIGRVGAAPLVIRDDPGATVPRIRAAARRVENLGLVVVDYVQLLRGDGRADNRQVEVAEISRDLKRMAGELEVPVVALSQLKRDADDRPPRLADLKESGALEQDADIVLLLGVSDEARREGCMDVHVAKQRNGPTGLVRLRVDRRTGRVWDTTPTPRPQPVQDPLEGAEADMGRGRRDLD